MPQRYLEDEHLIKLIEKTMDARDAKPKKFTFSRELNFGHLVVSVSFLITSFLGYLSFHDHNMVQDMRVNVLEAGHKQLNDNLAAITRTQDEIGKSVTQLTWIVDELKAQKQNDKK